MLTDPAEVLALAHLTLPQGVTGVTVTSKDDLIAEGYYYSYTVSWTGTIETTSQFLAEVGLSLEEIGTTDGFEELFLRNMSVKDIPHGSRGTSLPDFGPARGYGDLWVLIDGPDFTTVHVAVASFPM